MLGNKDHKFSYIKLTVKTNFSIGRRLENVEVESVTFFYPEFTALIVPDVSIVEYYSRTQPSIVKYTSSLVVIIQELSILLI